MQVMMAQRTFVGLLARSGFNGAPDTPITVKTRPAGQSRGGGKNSDFDGTPPMSVTIPLINIRGRDKRSINSHLC
jgi:hypothetical protein